MEIIRQDKRRRGNLRFQEDVEDKSKTIREMKIKLKQAQNTIDNEKKAIRDKK